MDIKEVVSTVGSQQKVPGSNLLGGWGLFAWRLYVFLCLHVFLSSALVSLHGSETCLLD